MKIPPLCPSCGKRSKLTEGKKLYPDHPDLHLKTFWACFDCSHWVGCHPGSSRPLGHLAGPALRRLRHSVHTLLDPMWKNGSISRSKAYSILAEKLGIPISACHVGQFDIETCQRAIQALQNNKTP